MRQRLAKLGLAASALGWCMVLLSLAACKLGSDDAEDRPLPPALEAAERSASDGTRSQSEPAPMRPARVQPKATQAPPLASAAQSPSTAESPNAAAPSGSAVVTATAPSAPATVPKPDTSSTPGAQCLRKCQLALAGCLAPTDAGLPTLASVSACQKTAAQCQAACL